MFYHDKKLQYTVKVDKPDPQVARALQQAIGYRAFNKLTL